MPPQRGIWEWKDAAGGFLRSSQWINSGSGSTAFETALQNCSNAQLMYSTVATPVIGTLAPGVTQYYLVTDLAVLNFATVPGQGVQIIIPGPLTSLFGSNSNVVDPTAPLTAALIVATIGTITDINGNLVTAYISGSKSSRRTEQT